MQYLRTGVYTPRPSVATIANAMDVGDPSNFARILDLYGGSHDAICAEVSGVSYTDEQIRRTMSETFRNERYLLDPHGACGYQALVDGLQPGETGICLETAHPAKFLETVESAVGETISVPENCKSLCREKTKYPYAGRLQRFQALFAQSAIKVLLRKSNSREIFPGCLIYTIVLFIVSEILFRTGFFRLPVLLELSMNGSRQTRSIPSCSSSR